MKKMISSAMGLAAALGILGFPGVGGSTYSKPRPLARHRKNPKDPHQAKRIEMAKAKRERKALKLTKDATDSWFFNETIDRLDDRRNPFYIAK